MNARVLIDTARAMVAGDKGLLAMDESNPTCNKRFAVLGLQLKFDSPGWSKFMTGETAQLVNRSKELLFAVPELAIQQ